MDFRKRPSRIRWFCRRMLLACLFILVTLLGMVLDDWGPERVKDHRELPQVEWWRALHGRSEPPFREWYVRRHLSEIWKRHHPVDAPRRG